MKYLFANSISIICVLSASAMIFYDKDGWGWFLFLALMFGHTFGGKK